MTVRPLYFIIGIAAIVGVTIATRGILSKTTTPIVGQMVPHVRVSSVADLSSQTGPLTVVGTVKSLNQANILAQTSGEIVSLSRSIGDTVSAGGVMGSFENSSQRAAVLQAQGGLDAANAALAKASGSSAANSSITSTLTSSTNTVRYIFILRL